MTMPFHIHNYLRDSRFAPREKRDAPVKTHKEYSRMPKVALPKPADLSMTLGEALENRSSTNKKGNVLSMQDLSTLLWHSLGVREGGLRRYPSGGALYPIETYLIALHVEGVSRSVFHYHPTSHALEDLWSVPQDFDIKNILLKEEKEPQALLILSGMWGKSTAKYGDFGYYLGMLEAGHMAQNVLLTSTALEIPATPLGGGFFEKEVETMLDLNPRFEQPIYIVEIS